MPSRRRASSSATTTRLPAISLRELTPVADRAGRRPERQTPARLRRVLRRDLRADELQERVVHLVGVRPGDGVRAAFDDDELQVVDQIR